MSVEAVAAGGVRDFPPPEGTRAHGESDIFRYHVSRAPRTFSIPVPRIPPDYLLLDVEAAQENGVFFMNAPELGVSVEADSVYDALAELIESVEEWLNYLRAEQPRLSRELEPQRRYIALLDYEPITWFRRLLTT